MLISEGRGSPLDVHAKRIDEQSVAILAGQRPIAISVVVPAKNEEKNLPILIERLFVALRDQSKLFEIIVVNDGSTDGSMHILRALAGVHSELRIVDLARNYGQTAAMMAGLDHARGEVIVPIDADLQNDPADIPRLLAKLDEGFDVVSGWRKDRKDYRKDVIGPVRLYGEMHRFVPIYAAWYGARITEIPVNHAPRLHGKSNYGLERVAKVILDLMVVRFLDRWIGKPIYIFGGFGLLWIAVATVSAAYMFYLKLIQHVSLILTPLPLLVVMSMMMGVMSISIGLVAEIVVRTYYESQNKRIYHTRELINMDAASLRPGI